MLEVLLTEFRAALVRKGFRRVDINIMYERAKVHLEIERQDPTGKLRGGSMGMLPFVEDC